MANSVLFRVFSSRNMVFDDPQVFDGVKVIPNESMDQRYSMIPKPSLNQLWKVQLKVWTSIMCPVIPLSWMILVYRHCHIAIIGESHTCKKREIAEIYLRNSFWIFRKILG